MQHTALRTRTKQVLSVSFAALLAVTLMAPSLALAEPSAANKQAEAQAALVSLNAMQEKLGKTADIYDEAVKSQQEAVTKRDEARVRIGEANDQIASLQDRLGSRARSMYRTGDATIFDLLLGATTFQAFANNWDILNSLNQNDAELVQETKDLRAEVQEQEAVLSEQEQIASIKADEAKQAKDDTATTMSAMQTTYDSLSAEATHLLAQERAAQEAAAAAQAQAVVDASIAQANPGGSDGGGGGSAGGGTGGGNNPGTGGGGSSSGGGYVPAPSPPYNSGTGSAVVDRAYGQLGKAYGYNDPSYGAGPNEFDCSGLVAYALSGSYSRMGSTAVFMAWPTASDPQPGDVAVSSGHCGVYIGGNQMIHSATYGVGVIIGPVQGGMKIVRAPW